MRDPEVIRTASGFQRLKAFTGHRTTTAGADGSISMASGDPLTSTSDGTTKQFPNMSHDNVSLG